MINETEARQIALSKMPKQSTIVKLVDTDQVYIMQIVWPDPYEGSLDPFFSVDKNTGYFRDFSLIDAEPKIFKMFTS